jgi:hypothetical protein
MPGKVVQLMHADAVADDFRSVLSPEEVRRAAGGYKRAADQLRELHRRGFFRAYRSKVTGEVVLERPHYDAVSAGLAPGIQPAGRRPQLRAVK